MSLGSRLVNAWLRLPPAESHRYSIVRDKAVTMDDGVTLLADHYIPHARGHAGGRYPTILVRSPYGRRGFAAALLALPFVTRGYQVFVQSVRGTAGSGGVFVYARNEQRDGLATIAWIQQQDWYSGQLAMIGPSYLGYVQWAVAAQAGSDLAAIVPSVTTSDFNRFRYQGGTITLETNLSWSTMMTQEAATGAQLNRRAIQQTRRRQRNLELAYSHLPLNEADRLVTGTPSQSYQELLAHPVDDPYWAPVDMSDTVTQVTAPVCMQSGWYDIFLADQIKDYQRLCAAGKHPSLLIGPWYHGQLSSWPAAIRDTAEWLDVYIKGKDVERRAKPVRLFVMGANTWRDFADWPPPAETQRWHLRAGGALAVEAPGDDTPDTYRYDPADPTPAVGGNVLGAQQRVGRKDNRALEARPDVLVYTSEPLDRDLSVIGAPVVDLYLASSCEYTDFFARLCVVESSGRSLNLCDNIVRLAPDTSPSADAAGIRHVRLELWPTAYGFKRGQRIRVQISSGAHPRFARNLGTGEPVATGTTMQVAEQTIYHDQAHPSSLSLPVVS